MTIGDSLLSITAEGLGRLWRCYFGHSAIENLGVRPTRKDMSRMVASYGSDALAVECAAFVEAFSEMIA